MVGFFVAAYLIIPAAALPGELQGAVLTAPQAVKKLHPCLIACVGATIGRPPTYRRNAFSGTAFLQGKRARASNARPYKRFSAVPRRGQDPSLQS